MKRLFKAQNTPSGDSMVKITIPLVITGHVSFGDCIDKYKGTSGEITRMDYIQQSGLYFPEGVNILSVSFNDTPSGDLPPNRKERICQEVTVDVSKNGNNPGLIVVWGLANLTDPLLSMRTGTFIQNFNIEMEILNKTLTSCQCGWLGLASTREPIFTEDSGYSGMTNMQTHFNTNAGSDLRLITGEWPNQDDKYLNAVFYPDQPTAGMEVLSSAIKDLDSIRVDYTVVMDGIYALDQQV